MSKDGNEGGQAEYTPSEEWIETFAEQCTDDMRLKAKLFAARRLSGIASSGGHVDDYAARELVQDILGDTLLGIRIWDPAAKTLRQHVEDAISSRAKHRRDRAKKYRHNRVDAFEPGAEYHDARGEMESSLQMDRDDDSMTSVVFAREIVDKMRTLADGDTHILRYLDAIEAGAQTKNDITNATKMSEKTFRNTRARLRRLLEQFDNQAFTGLRQA